MSLVVFPSSPTFWSTSRHLVGALIWCVFMFRAPSRYLVISQSKSCLYHFRSKRSAAHRANHLLKAMMLPEPEPCQVRCSVRFPSKESKMSTAKHLYGNGVILTVPVSTSLLVELKLYSLYKRGLIESDGFRAHRNSEKTGVRQRLELSSALHEAPPETENMAEVRQGGDGNAFVWFW